MRAFFIASANARSSFATRGSMKWRSKETTRAPSLARISVRRAWSERGHLSGLSGRLNCSDDSRSMLTTTASRGGRARPPQPEQQAEAHVFLDAEREMKGAGDQSGDPHENAGQIPLSGGGTSGSYHGPCVFHRNLHFHDTTTYRAFSSRKQIKCGLKEGRAASGPALFLHPLPIRFTDRTEFEPPGRKIGLPRHPYGHGQGATCAGQPEDTPHVQPFAVGVPATVHCNVVVFVFPPGKEVLYTQLPANSSMTSFSTDNRSFI